MESPNPQLKPLILFQDEAIIVVDKPSGLLVHPSKEATDRQTLMSILRDQCGAWVYPIHRLDRATSGLMVMAKSSEAASLLGDQFQKSLVQKEYLALVRDYLKEPITIDKPLTSDKGEQQQALTVFEPLRYFDRCTLIKAMPKTGRRHQIRRHLAHIKHQIIGDTQYGKGNINRFFREHYLLPHLFLHSCALSFLHPHTLVRHSYYCALPPELAKVLKQLNIVTQQFELTN